MAEYIERETIKEVFSQYGGTEQMEQLIDSLPAADVVEVRHGTVVQLDHDEWWGAVYKCCECEGEFMLYGSKQAVCCPYCGVLLKMDGKGDGE